MFQARNFSSWSRRKKAAEAEGIDKILIAAGFQWRESGCSMCFFAGGEAMGLEQGVDRRVAVAVDEELGAAVVDPPHHLVELRLRQRRLAAPVALSRRAARQVGRREERRFPLG